MSGICGDRIGDERRFPACSTIFPAIILTAGQQVSVGRFCAGLEVGFGPHLLKFDRVRRDSYPFQIIRPERRDLSMAKRRGRKNTKQPVSIKDNCDHDVDSLNKKEESFQGHEVEPQSAAIRAIRDVEIEQLQTMLMLLKSNFSEEQLQIPVLEFFKENLPNLTISESSKDGQCEVKWRHEQNQADEKTLHASLLHRLSMAYPDYSAGIPSVAGGFEFSNKSVKTGIFADKLQIRSLVFEETSDSQIKDGLQTPNASNNRLSVGITPKTVRLPKCGEMLLSVHGSPLGIFKEDNMETIQEMEDG